MHLLGTKQKARLEIFMNLLLLAADIADRVQALAQDCPTNRETVIASLLNANVVSCEDFVAVLKQCDEMAGEILMLKASRAVACEQEQVNRIECNRLRAELQSLKNPTPPNYH